MNRIQSQVRPSIGVLAHLQRSRYVSVTLTDGSGIAGFYQRFEFRVCKAVAQVWERETEAISKVREPRVV